MRFHPFNFHYNEPVNISTCVDPTVSSNYQKDVYYIGNNSDWALQDEEFQSSTSCYSSFTQDMESDSLAFCPSFTTTTTSTSTTTEAPSTTSELISSPDEAPPSDVIFPTPPSTSVPLIQCATDKICRYYLDWNQTYVCVLDGAQGTVTSISGTHYLTFTDLDVKRVYFINSFLNLIPKLIFQKFPNLNYLHVSECGLNVINNQTLNECGKLEFLDASHNEINHVDETSLANCTMLKVIDLSGNPIDHVGGLLYKLDPALERIHLKRLDDWILA
jgi:Leucine-rich repeat (LRR) protein